MPDPILGRLRGVLVDAAVAYRRRRRRRIAATTAALVIVVGMGAGVVALSDQAPDTTVAVNDTEQPGVGDEGRGEPEESLYEGTFTVLESPEHGPELCNSVMTSDPPQCGGLPVEGWSWEQVEGEQSRNGTTWGRWHVTGTYSNGRLHLTEPPEAPRKETSLRDRPGQGCKNPETVDASHGAMEWESISEGDAEGTIPIPGLVTVWFSNDTQQPYPASGDADPSSREASDRPGSVINVIVRPGFEDRATDKIREHYLGALCVIERDLPTKRQLRAIQEEVVMDEESRDRLDPAMVYSDESRGVVVVDVWVADDAARTYAHERWGGLVEVRGLLKPTR